MLKNYYIIDEFTKVYKNKFTQNKDNEIPSVVGTFIGIIDKDKFIIKNKIPNVDETKKDFRLEKILFNPKHDKMIASQVTLVEDKSAEPQIKPEGSKPNRPPFNQGKPMKVKYNQYLFDIK